MKRLLLKNAAAVLVILLLAASAAAQNTARLQAHNITVPEGTPKARIPVTISSEYEDQTIAGLHTVVTVGLDSAPVPIVDHDTTLTESIFASHPNYPILQTRPLSKNSASILQLAWLPPYGEIETGVVAMVTVDTSGLPPGEYPILIDRNRTSGVVTADGSMYRPLEIADSIRNGRLTVVPRRE